MKYFASPLEKLHNRTKVGRNHTHPLQHCLCKASLWVMRRKQPSSGTEIVLTRTRWMAPWRRWRLYARFHHLFILLYPLSVRMQINSNQVLTKYSFSLQCWKVDGGSKYLWGFFFFLWFMINSCRMLRNYVNECMPAHTDTETRQEREKKKHNKTPYAQSVVSSNVGTYWNSSHEKKKARRFKICCQEKNKLYGWAQKKEQSFVFAFLSCKCNPCFSSE